MAALTQHVMALLCTTEILELPGISGRGLHPGSTGCKK
jgi:hypothetical protein